MYIMLNDIDILNRYVDYLGSNVEGCIVLKGSKSIPDKRVGLKRMFCYNLFLGPKRDSVLVSPDSLILTDRNQESVYI